MSNNTQPGATTSETSGKGMRQEIAAKWAKFSTQEIADLKDKDDLVAKVQGKYALDPKHAVDYKPDIVVENFSDLLRYGTGDFLLQSRAAASAG